MKPFCFADGQIISTEKASIHPMDLSFIRGYGIFDFFRTVNFKALFLDNYLDRFFASAEKTFLPLDYSRAELKAVIQDLIEKNNLKEGGIRMLLSGGISPNHFSPAKGKLYIFAESLIFPAQEKYDIGIKLLSLEYVRPIAEIKTTNYALPVWDSMRWKDAGAEDVLYHMNGNVSESSRSNFFIVKDGIISTPDAHVLMGITRKHVIELVGEVQIRPISMQEVLNADETFITSTTKVLLPVIQIDEHEIGTGKPGPVSLDLLAKFRELEKELCY